MAGVAVEVVMAVATVLVGTVGWVLSPGMTGSPEPGLSFPCLKVALEGLFPALPLLLLLLLLLLGFGQFLVFRLEKGDICSEGI